MQIASVCIDRRLTMQPNGKASRWLSAREASKYSGLGFSTLAKLRLLRTGPVYTKVGAKILYNTVDIDAWLESKRVANISQYAA
jgi:hypothetical protein